MRTIIVKIETDSEESFDLIKDDIEQELSCCWNWSHFDNVEISEEMKGEDNAEVHCTDEFEKQIKPYDTDDRVEKAMYIFAHNKMLCTPTADVVERKIGKWIDPASKRVYRCSVCEEYTTLEVPGLFYHYCPNCGAKMEANDGNVH